MALPHSAILARLPEKSCYRMAIVLDGKTLACGDFYGVPDLDKVWDLLVPEAEKALVEHEKSKQWVKDLADFNKTPALERVKGWFSRDKKPTASEFSCRAS